MTHIENELTRMESFPHSRVIAHLSRYSLSSWKKECRPCFYLILTQASFLDSNLVRIAMAFGCGGFIVCDNEKSGRVKEVSSVLALSSEEFKVHFVQSLEEARNLVKTRLLGGGCEIIGVTSKREDSISVSHPNAFPTSCAFIFGDQSDLFICDRFVHVPNLSGGKDLLQLEHCASIVFYRFAEGLPPVKPTSTIPPELLPTTLHMPSSSSPAASTTPTVVTNNAC